MTDRWIQLGHHINTWGDEIPVGLPMEDMKVHTSVLGTTGAGKSAFLRNVALQGFMHGATVIVLEPHGDLILDEDEGILAAIPPSYLNRVTVVDLNSPMPPQLNLAGASLYAGRSAAVQTAMRCIQVQEEASWSGAVRMREILEHALHLLLGVYGEKAGMIHLQKFLDDNAFRVATINQASDVIGESRSYWQRQNEQLNKMLDKGEGILEVPRRRVGGFLRDERFRRSLSLPLLHPEMGLDIAKLMNQSGNMILVPLQSSALGESAKRVFGTLFMQLVTNSFMARANQGVDARQQTIVIIDEFADMAGGEIGIMVKKLLAEARKFGASVVLATQAMHQLPRDVKEEWKSNTNIKIMLRTTSPDDAKVAVENLAHPTLKPQDILAVAKYHGYAKVMINKDPQPAFYFRTMPPLNFSDMEVSAEYGEHRDGVKWFENEVTKQLEQLHNMTPEEAVNALRFVTPERFEKLVQAQVWAGRYAAQQLMNDPSLEPSPVQRALQISRAKNGLPFWFYEAAYRRERFGMTDEIAEAAEQH